MLAYSDLADLGQLASNPRQQSDLKALCLQGLYRGQALC